MHHPKHHGADLAPRPAARRATPLKDETPGLAGTEGFKDQGIADTCDSAGASPSGQALRVIEGQCKAEQFLACLQAQQADPDELALIVSMLYGATLRGFCRVIERALAVRHA